MNATHPDGRSMALWLGYLGLIPFLAGAGLALVGEPALRDLAIRAVLAYGAVIASFVGAIHWGLALTHRGPQAPGLYLVSVLPALAAWLALLLTPRTGLPLLIATFVALWLYERARLWASVFPDWFAQLRTRLSAVAVLTLAVLWALTPGL